jgi:putative spermidine/putrescine transport system ATP-binding protein
VAGYLDIAGVAKRFRQTTVLNDLSLSVARGEFISLLGPSGCGKTTLLRVLAGLLAADRGRVTLDGRDLGALPPHRRNIGVVFQNYALFPHLSVADNIGFGLRARRRPKAEIAEAVRRALAMIRLEQVADRSVAQLSGGQQQRVAVARALAVNPSLILLDEPLSALDRKLREIMQVELRQILRGAGMTAIFVTHDQEEALALSDRIAVMNAGVIEQLGSPSDIYARPATPFVLDFVGLATTVAGTVRSSGGAEVELDTPSGPVRAPGRLLNGARAMIAVRPENVRLGRAEGDGWTGMAATATAETFLGSRRLLHARGDAGDPIVIELANTAAPAVDAGQRIEIAWRVSDSLLYPAP